MAGLELLLLVVLGGALIARRRRAGREADGRKCSRPAAAAAKPRVARAEGAPSGRRRVASLARSRSLVLNGNGRQGAAAAAAQRVSGAATAFARSRTLRGWTIRAASSCIGAASKARASGWRDLGVRAVGPLDGIRPGQLHGAHGSSSSGHSPRVPIARFCSACGARLTGLPPVVCTECGAEHWRNAKPCANAIVAENGRVLLALRAHAPWLGAWGAPGGFCEYDEHPIEAVEREVLEEVGLPVRVTGFIGIWLSRYADTAGPENDVIASPLPRPTDGQATGELDAAEVAEARWSRGTSCRSGWRSGRPAFRARRLARRHRSRSDGSPCRTGPN